MALVLRGEPLVHKLAMVAKYVVYPAALVTAVVVAPSKPNKPTTSSSSSSS